MTDFDAERIRDALIAARDLTNLGATRRHTAGTSSGHVLRQSTRVRALLAEHLDRSGPDAAAVERELAAGRAESVRRLAQHKVDAVRQSTSRAGALRSLVEAHKAALQSVAASGPAIEYHAIDSPVEIWATDSVDLESSTIQPWNSRAKVRLDLELYHGWQSAILQGPPEFLHFYYLWHNQRDTYTVVTVNGWMALNGFCSAHSRGGAFLGGYSRLRLDPSLDLVETWTQPISSAPAQAGQSQHALDISADSRGLFTDDQTTYVVEFRGFLLSYEQAIVPPDQYLIIDVALSFTAEVDNGKISADFATGEFDVLCPLVEVATLS
jgi:hypothetical protein